MSSVRRRGTLHSIRSLTGLTSSSSNNNNNSNDNNQDYPNYLPLYRIPSATRSVHSNTAITPATATASGSRHPNAAGTSDLHRRKSSYHSFFTQDSLREQTDNQHLSDTNEVQSDVLYPRNFPFNVEKSKKDGSAATDSDQVDFETFGQLVNSTATTPFPKQQQQTKKRMTSLTSLLDYDTYEEDKQGFPFDTTATTTHIPSAAPISPTVPSETLITQRPTSLIYKSTLSKRFQLFSSQLGLIQLDELLNEDGQKALETIIGQTTTSSKKKRQQQQQQQQQESQRREQLLQQQGLLIEDSFPNTSSPTPSTAVDPFLAASPASSHSSSSSTRTGCWWMDCSNPTPKEMEVISKTFRIHPLTTEDIQVQEQREKVEFFPHYTFVCARAFDVDPISELIKPFNFYILIFKEGLVTFHFQPSPHCDTVRERCDQLKNYMDMTPDWMNYALIDAITDSFAPIILEVEMEAVSIDELSLVLRKADRADMLKRISRCRKKSTQLARLLGSKIDVIKSLKKRYQEKMKEHKLLQQQYQQQQQSPESVELQQLQQYQQQLFEQFPFSDVLLYLSDIQDHVVTMIQNINHYDRILHRAHTNYLAQVNLELIETYNRTNSVMNRLTFLATVFIPLTLIGSLWGMNVYVPGKDHTDNTYFWWILAGMAIYTTVSLHFGRRLALL